MLSSASQRANRTTGPVQKGKRRGRMEKTEARLGDPPVGDQPTQKFSVVGRLNTRIDRVTLSAKSHILD